MKYLCAVIVSLFVMIGAGCGNSATGKAVMETINSNVLIPTEPEQGDPYENISLRDIVEADDNFFTTINLHPSDGDYYFGDLTKAPGRGWYGSYGGEYVSVKLEDIRYLDGFVRFVMATFGFRLMEDGTETRTETDFYYVDLTREQFIEGIKKFREEDTEAVVIEAEVVLVERSE